MVAARERLGSALARVAGPCKGMLMLTLLFVFFLGLGLILGTVMLIRVQRLRSRGVRTTGSIIKHERAELVHRPGQTRSYRAVVEFEIPGRGKFSFTSSLATPAGGGRVGSTVPVIYDPERPLKAIIATWPQTWGPVAISVAFAAVGLGGLIATLFVL
jgi:Protein of unknown function (DUF3592)